MKLGEVISFFKDEHPGLMRDTSFTPPAYGCTRWILVRGPAYGEAAFRGSLLVEAGELLVWANEHAKNCWSTDKADQQAREFLPTWLREADLGDESVTLMGKILRGVLEDYDQNFMAFGRTQLYCPECNALHGDAFVRKPIDKGRTEVHEWTCSVGHHVYQEEREMPLAYLR